MCSEKIAGVDTDESSNADDTSPLLPILIVSLITMIVIGVAVFIIYRHKKTKIVRTENAVITQVDKSAMEDFDAIPVVPYSAPYGTNKYR